MQRERRKSPFESAIGTILSVTCLDMNAMASIESSMRAGRWAEAQAACRELLFSRPTDARLHALEGICLFRLGDFAAAEPCFKRATALDPSFVDAGVKRCQCLERMKMFDEAVYLAREWQNRRPGDPTLRQLVHTYGNRPDPNRTEAWEVGRRKGRCVEYAA